MKKTFFIIAFLLIENYVFSQTNVSGPYFTNTTWNISDSPYNIVGDVQIPTGVTLTISSGVQINFTGNYEILIKGTIICVGTNSLPINFNGSTSGTAMLMFKSTSLNNSQLSHVNFTGPKNALQLGDESEFNQSSPKNSGVLTVSNVIFTNTKVQTKGYQTTASLIIDSATITTSTLKGMYPRSETIDVRNSTLLDCILNSDSYNKGIIIRNSYVSNSNFTIGCCGGNISLISSTLSASTIFDGGGQPVTGPLKIIDSKLDNTPINLPTAKVEVTGTVINYNTLNGLIFGNGLIGCSDITGNGSGTAVTITGYSSGNFLIKNSSISQNLVGIKISNANTMTIDSNNFDNNSSFNIENLSVKNISANNNWWGTTDLTTISNKIYDYYDNINYGIVSYPSFLSTAYNSESCPTNLTFPTSIHENENNISSSVFGLKIYPNPSTEYIFFEYENSNKENKEIIIEIINTVGKTLFVSRLNESMNSQTIDVANFSKGVYFCKIQSRKDIELRKILIH